MRGPPGDTGIRRALAWGSLLLGTLALSFGLLSSQPRRSVFFGFAVAGLLVAPVARSVRAVVGQACVTTWLTAFLLFLAYLVLPVRVPALDRTFKPIPFTPTGIWETDPRLGYSHKPNSSGPHLTHDFNVVYTIDENGFRVTPTPASSKGRVLVVGGSFAVGHGVADDETFSSVLGKRYWTDYKLVNGAVSGWGTAHCYLRVMQELDGPDPPVLVIYAMLWHHVQRNYLRREWLQRVRLTHAAREDGVLAVGEAGAMAYHPHFELVDGRPQLQGFVSRKSGLEVTPQLRRTELRLTEAFIREMHATAASRGADLALVLLGRRKDRYPESFLRFLESHEIPYLDLSDRLPTGFRDDRHPNPADHRWIAEQIARSPIADLLPD